ncbi:MAG: hypothetical protein AB8B55_21460 [Mariniblastus sp.]
MDSKLARSPDEPVVAIEKPKLSLMYLFAFVTGFALMLGDSENSFSIGSTRPTPTDETWRAIFDYSRVFTGAICLTGMFIAFNEWRSTRRIATHPGYLLLIACGTLILLETVANFTLAFLDNPQDQAVLNGGTYKAKWLYWCVLQIISLLVLIGVTILGTFRDRWWWRIPFGLQFIAFLAQIFLIATRMAFVAKTLGVKIEHLMYVSNIYACVFLVTLFFFIGSLITDLAKRRQRDWVHWMGCLGFVLTMYLPWLLSTIAVRFMSPLELYGMP